MTSKAKSKIFLLDVDFTDEDTVDIFDAIKQPLS